MRPGPNAPPQPTDDADIARLQALLDQLPAALAPLDVSAIDGWLCAVLIHPEAVAETRWLPPLVDANARPLPADLDLRELRGLLRRRHAELGAAIDRRQWFDPWLFELESPAGAADSARPWVAGFALALEHFDPPLPIELPAVLGPLAQLYQYLPEDDLDAEDALRTAIAALEPPDELGEVAQDLVQAVLLLADVTRPVAAPRLGRAPRRKARRLAARPRPQA